MEYGEIPKDDVPDNRLPETSKHNCVLCKYYRVTWEQNAPRACTIFGFKSKEMPTLTVKRITGQECPSFSPKKK